MLGLSQNPDFAVFISIGFDAAENGPSNIRAFFRETGAGEGGGSIMPGVPRSSSLRRRGYFSAVSKPILASKN